MKNSGGKEDVITEAAVFVPQTDPDDAADAGNYTLPEKAELKDGSIGVLTIDSIGVSAPVFSRLSSCLYVPPVWKPEI